MIHDLKVEDGCPAFSVRLTTPACPLKGRIERESREAVMTIPGVERVNIRMDAKVIAGSRGGRLDLPMKNMIAVASGQRTKSELAGVGEEEFAPWVIGPVM